MGTKHAPHAPKLTDQLALFAPGELHAVIERLRNTDANTLTPLEALQLVADLARQANA